LCGFSVAGITDGRLGEKKISIIFVKKSFFMKPIKYIGGIPVIRGYN
jgi:hypothetical protein